MAGRNFAGSEEHDDFLPFRHFFKVVLPEAIRDKKLMLPEKFGGTFRDNLTREVSLKVPDGRVWLVRLSKHRINPNKVWLSLGFADFLSFYSIAAGHMLFFKYNGGSDLQVVICDTCACEVTYPSVEESHNTDDEDDDDDDDEDGEEEDSDQGNEGEGERLRLRAAASSIVTSTRFWLSFNELSVRSKEAVKRAMDDRSNPENPMVLVVLSKYHVTDGMYLPSEFSNKYFPRDVATVTLLAHEENGEFVGEWEMLAKITDRFIIQQEWIAFCHGNGYAEGDVCLFSLIEETRKIFNVHIFRAG